jgi:CRISPR system Cascade subunit CasC
VTVIGRPEIEYLLELARRAADGTQDAKEARSRWKELFQGDAKKNIQALARGAGLDAALFGRMVTGDVLARCDAAVHVAHAFTVHPGFFETDYFSAVDDLQDREETGSGHINTAELTTGLYYGYVVVDLPLLVSNLEGCRTEDWLAADRSLAAEVARRLVHLVATVSPGAKQGATAPYALALAVLAETGDHQPRTLANAYLDAVRGGEGLLAASQARLAGHLAGLDAMYGRSTQRRLAAAEPPEDLLVAVDSRLSLAQLGEWVAGEVTAA